MDRGPRERERKSDVEWKREGEREEEREGGWKGGWEGGKEGRRGREVEGREGAKERESEREREQEKERERHTHVSLGGADYNGKWRAHTRTSVGTHRNTHTYTDASP